MEPIKNVLNQAGHLVQQAAHTVAEVFHGSETATADSVCVTHKFFFSFVI